MASGRDSSADKVLDGAQKVRPETGSTTGQGDWYFHDTKARVERNPITGQHRYLRRPLPIQDTEVAQKT